MSRSRRTVAAIAAAAGLAAIAAACTAALSAHGARPRSGPLSVRAGLAHMPRRYVRGGALFGGDGERTPLAASVSGALMGPLSPVAVAAPGGAAVAYSAWQKLRDVDPQRSFSRQGISDGDGLGVPSVRLLDADGKDSLVARGAYSLAWRADGAIAYFKGADPVFRANRPYLGTVVVRGGVHGRSVDWTPDAGRYVVYAWAGERLLFYRVGEGETLQLLVADGPGRIRELAEGSAVAVSPDGRRVMVLSPDATNVRVLDVATGREQAWLDVTTATAALRWIAYAGSWHGDHVVAPANVGLAVFHVGADSIEVEQILDLDQAQFPAGVQEPQFVGPDADEVTATADVPPSTGSDGVTYMLDCSRVTRACERSEAIPATEWPRFVANPSRPGGDR